MFNPKVEYSGYWLLLMSKGIEWYLGGTDRTFQKILFYFLKISGWNIGFPLLFLLIYIYFGKYSLIRTQFILKTLLNVFALKCPYIWKEAFWESYIYLHDNKKKVFDYPIVSYLFGQLETVPLCIINCKWRPFEKGNKSEMQNAITD